MPALPAADVDAMLDERAHPLAPTVNAVRSVLLDVAGVREGVKWNAPNYALADDFATMNLRRDNAVQLILHTGAKPKPEHPEIDILPLPAFARRADRNRLVLTLTSPQLADADRREVDRIVRAWVQQLA